jgi:hypothetical protein
VAREQMGAPGLQGSFGKNQRRALVFVNAALLILGFWIWKFVGGLIEDALLTSDVRLGWVLWLSFVAGAGTIVLSCVGCYGNLYSNNVLFGYTCVCLVEFVMLWAAAKHGFTDVELAEQWVVDNWPVLKIQLGDRIPPTVDEGVADVRHACEVVRDAAMTMCVLLMVGILLAMWVLTLNKICKKSIMTISVFQVGMGPIGTVLSGVLARQDGADGLFIGATAVVGLAVIPLALFGWVTAKKESEYMCKMHALGSFLLLACLIPLYQTYDMHAAELEAAALAAEPPLNTTQRLAEMQEIIAAAEAAANAGSSSWDGDPLSALPSISREELWMPWYDDIILYCRSDCALPVASLRGCVLTCLRLI